MWMIRLATTQDSEMSLHHLSFRKEGAENMATDMWLLENIESWGGLAFEGMDGPSPKLHLGMDRKLAGSSRQLIKNQKN